jgi:hypothetical protein
MGAFVTQLSEISYNGIEFTDVIRSNVRSKTVYGKSGINVKYVEYTFIIETILNADNVDVGINNFSLGDGLEYFRVKLNEPMKRFTYNDKGLGDLTIGVLEANEPTDYGPKPQTLVFEPIANNRAVRVVWEMTVKIPECFSGTSSIRGGGGVCDFNISSKVSINRKGYQTLTRTGYLEFARTNSEFRKRDKASDVFKRYIGGSVDPRFMLGYHLEQDYSFTPDGRAVEFSLVYSEIESPNAYPTGVVDISFQHQADTELISSNVMKSGLTRWMNEAECSIELVAGADPLRAWVIFTTIISERILNGATLEDFVKNGNRVQRLKVPIILSIKVVENLYEHKSSFAISWSTSVSKLSELFEKTGLYQRTKDDWQTWTTTVRNLAQNINGHTPIVDYGETEVVLTTCNQNLKNVNPSTVRLNGNDNVPNIFSKNCPPAEASWIDYQNSFNIESYATVQTYRTYQDNRETSVASRDDNWRPETQDGNVRVDNRYEKNVDLDDYYLQDNGVDRHYVRMRGYAIRLGRATTPPKLVSIAGKKVQLVPNKNVVSTRIMSAAGDCPTYMTTWDVTYEVLGSLEGGNLEGNRESTGEPGDYQ